MLQYYRDLIVKIKRVKFYLPPLTFLSIQKVDLFELIFSLKEKHKCLKSTKTFYKLNCVQFFSTFEIHKMGILCDMKIDRKNSTKCTLKLHLQTLKPMFNTSTTDLLSKAVPKVVGDVTAINLFACKLLVQNYAEEHLVVAEVC